jgi:hypothetical protein
MLAVRGELRPDIGDALLVAQNAPFDERVRDRGRHALPGRCGKEHRCCGDRLWLARIDNSGNRVSNHLALVQNRDLQPGLRTGADEIVDRGLNAPLDVNRHAHADTATSG